MYNVGRRFRHRKRDLLTFASSVKHSSHHWLGTNFFFHCLQVVLAEKPLIAEETDLIEPTLLDELICHIASLASVYHKPPSAFVEGRTGLRRALPKVSWDDIYIYIFICVLSASRR